MKLLIYIRMLRLQNTLMAGMAVFLGYWLTGSDLMPCEILFPILAAIAATGFGNVINDIRDIETDRISHPQRPLPRGEISIPAALIYSSLLAITAILLSFYTSLAHGFATLIPLILLLAYAVYLKGTRLAGNFIVASLVAYALLYGGINRPDFMKLLIPAFLAFLLNLSREVVKDIQDETGDKAAGYKTSASLPRSFLRYFIYICSVIYFSALPFPVILGHLGLIYAAVTVSAVVPVHIYRLRLIKTDMDKKLSLISQLFKVEMLAGLTALAADKLF